MPEAADEGLCMSLPAVIDWEDPEAARALTKTLLHHDFKLEWDIPLDRLCPPVGWRHGCRQRVLCVGHARDSRVLTGRDPCV